MGVLINTTYFLKLQPYCWLQPNILYSRPGTASASTTVNLSTLAVLGKLAVTRQNYIQAILALDATGLNQITPAEKKATYSGILTACNPQSAQWANMLPVYGIEPDAVSGEVKTLPGVKPEDILFNLIAAIAYAQDNSVVANLKKGVIIPIIVTIPDANYTALKDAVWSTSEYTNINTYTQANNFVTRVIIVSYDNLNLPGYLTEIQTNATMILLIKMNGLPVQAFNNMYIKSTLPGMFEGKGTASYMLNSSLSFFNLTPLATQRYIYPSLPLAGMSSAMSVACTRASYNFNTSLATTNGAIGTVANTAFYALFSFLQNIYNAPTYTAYFTEIQTYFHDEQNDKLVGALFYLLSASTL